MKNQFYGKDGHPALSGSVGARSRTPHPASAALKLWQLSKGRHGFAWQQQNSLGFRDPCKVWLSEIMLQQTQVSTVVSYFDRFIAAFPTLLALSLASEDDVFSLWSGLGYYRRAKFLLECAQTIQAKYKGEFPRSIEDLCSLPGIGPTTAAAIASFCFGERVSIFDGNVERFSSRFFGFEGDVSVAKNRNLLWSNVSTLLPSESAGMPCHTQGLMDLGSLVCKPNNPTCEACPVSTWCQVFIQKRNPKDFPLKTKKTKRLQQQNVWLWLQCEDEVWLQKRPSTGIWAGLWSAPILDADQASEIVSRHHLLLVLKPVFKHLLSHRDWIFHPASCTVPRCQKISIENDERLGPGQWVRRDGLSGLGFSAPTSKALQCWMGEETYQCGGK